MGLMVKCVNAHDRCYGGAGGSCEYCEPQLPLRTKDGRFASLKPQGGGDMDAPERIKAWVWDLDYPSKKNGVAEWNATMFPADQDCHDYIRADLMEELVGLLQEARTDLQSYVDHDYPPETCAAHPSVARQHFRDMELCRRIDAAIAKIKEPQHG